MEGFKGWEVDITEIQKAVDKLSDYDTRYAVFESLRNSLYFYDDKLLTKGVFAVNLVDFLSDGRKFCQTSASYIFQTFIQTLPDSKGESVSLEDLKTALFNADLPDDKKEAVRFVLCSLVFLLSQNNFCNHYGNTDFWISVSSGDVVDDKALICTYFAEIARQQRKNKTLNIRYSSYGANFIRFFDMDKPGVEESLAETRRAITHAVGELTGFIHGLLESDVDLAYTFLALLGRWAEVEGDETLDDLLDMEDYRVSYLTEMIQTCGATLQSHGLPVLGTEDNVVDFFAPIREKYRIDDGVAVGKESKNNGRI